PKLFAYTRLFRSEEEHVFVAFLDAQVTLGVAPLAREGRVFQDEVELHLVPAVFAAADGVATHNGRMIEAVKYGIHRGHTDDVLISRETVKRSLLQKFQLRGLQEVADPALYR